ncbi:hypothetical protein O3M35_007747 [Rhynocoris fuscipes]|uniref:Uncharacterized protein n=1 Tax=Rhynocoris fuscipes TaxID=488301 RepID=A0AAW1DFP4_9HEMI
MKEFYQSKTIGIRVESIKACDFNLPSGGRQAENLLDEYTALINTYQINSVPNHSNVVLDLVFSSDRSSVVSKSKQPLVGSDPHHPPLEISFPIKTVQYTKFKKKVLKDFGKGNYDEINLINLVNW